MLPREEGAALQENGFRSRIVVHMNPVEQVCLAVCPAVDTDPVRASAAVLARELSLPLITGDKPSHGKYDLLLTVGPDRLELGETRRRTGGPIFVDFAAGPVGYRRRTATGRRQPLARAIGIRHGPVTVVDATAGLGRDSFLLACLGCRVVAVERSAVLGALLSDGLARAGTNQDETLRTIVRRISLRVADAREVLAGMVAGAEPDVVYLDPMYPPKRRTALMKKEMRICRRLVGDDEDAEELWAVARRVARRRIVVKRHRHAPPLGPQVAIKYQGKMVRYDVYHPTS